MRHIGVELTSFTLVDCYKHMSESTPTSPQRSNHIQSPNSKRSDEWNGLQGRRRLVRHVGVKLATFTFVDYFFCHLICSWPVKSRSVCFGHNGPRGRMVTTGPRVDFIEDHSTFFRCYAFLAYYSYASFEQLPPYHSKSFGSADGLSGLFFVLWEFLPKDVRNVRHRPVGSDDQNLHD